MAAPMSTSPIPTLAEWLASMPESELAALLPRRPDALARPQPRTITELAERLEGAPSLAAVLQALPLPAVQLAEAVGALGVDPTPADLAALVGADAEQVARWLAVLTDHAIVWPAPGEALCSPEALPGLFGHPLGLGPPLRGLVAAMTVDQMRRVLGTLGVPKPPTRRAEVVAIVERMLSDPDTVRGVVSRAPEPVADELTMWARRGAGDDPGDDDLYDPEAYRRRKAAAQWGIEHGIVAGSTWSLDWTMAAEVARALRGPDYRAPFDPTPPAVATIPISSDELAQRSARSVSQFADLVLALVDRVARTPVPALKSGGIGVREIDRLAKALGCEEHELRLALELCAATGILESAGRTWSLGQAAGDWREAAPADRMATLLRRWWTLPITPGDALDEDGKRASAMVPRPCGGCLLARQAVVTTLAGLGASADLASLCQRAVWLRPFAHVLDQDATAGDGVLFATHLAEAAALGIVAAGAVTPIGAAVIAGDAPALHTALAAALPDSSDTALFGADLTAVVSGAPSAAVSRLLDSAADRESRGGAVVWRFSPGSVRRALDAGATAESLAESLAAIATGELPQPLRYLIGDIGRQHGNLRVSGATSVIRGTDEALLATVAADRSLRKLGLRRLAPTVLVSDAEESDVLAGLRAAGYLPMPEADPTDGQDRRQPQGSRAASTQPARDRGPTVAEVVRAFRGDRTPRAPERLLGADALAARLAATGLQQEQPPGATEQELRRDRALVRALSPDEIRILAAAIETSGRVGIDYLTQAGTPSHRVIAHPQLFGDSVAAWCELRAAERWFRLDRIRGVFQADQPGQPG